MRKIASPSDLHHELWAIMALNRHGATREDLGEQLRKLAARVTAADDDSDADASGLPVKKGEWTIWVLKDRATRWRYTLHNPQGGSEGSGSYTSAKAAFSNGTSRVLWKGANRLYVVSAKWNADKEEYVVSKQSWVDIPDQGEKGHGTPIPVPKLDA